MRHRKKEDIGTKRAKKMPIRKHREKTQKEGMARDYKREAEDR